jgi:hypothetical protein
VLAVTAKVSAMSQLKLESWASAVSKVRTLGNHCVSANGGNIEFSLADVATNERHIFAFKEVLGFRYQIAFNMQRIGNSFLVMDSAWIQAMQSEPFRAIKLDTAKHYLFDSYDGQFEIVALQEPSYRCASDG